jgi:hypothetical protein
LEQGGCLLAKLLLLVWSVGRRCHLGPALDDKALQGQRPGVDGLDLDSRLARLS